MKKIFDNWSNYLLKEQTELWGYHIRPEQRVFISPDKFTGMRGVDQDPPDPKEFFGSDMKPKGLWYACGDDWIRWLRINQEEWIDDSKYLYEIELTNPPGWGGDLYHLNDDVNELKGFAEMFQTDALDYAGRRRDTVDWRKVQMTGAMGIEICPYDRKIYRDGFRAPWYEAWDASSGCIWNPRAIKEVRLLAVNQENTETKGNHLEPSGVTLSQDGQKE